MTATRPPVVSAEALTWRARRGTRAPRPRRRPSAMGATLCCCVGSVVVGTLAPRPAPATSPRRGDLSCGERDHARRLPRWRAGRQRTGCRGGRAARRAAGSRASEYFAELGPRLRRSIDSDATCWHTLDPQTRLLTSDAPRRAGQQRHLHGGDGRAAGELLVRSEYMVDDVNTFADLARRRARSGSSSHATGGQPGAQRALPRPARAVRHPSRAARSVRRRGRVWGAVHIARRDDQRAVHAARRSGARAGRGRDRRGHPRVAALRRRRAAETAPSPGPGRARTAATRWS